MFLLIPKMIKKNDMIEITFRVKKVLGIFTNKLSILNLVKSVNIAEFSVLG